MKKWTAKDIVAACGEDGVLDQLAEECCELAKACMKVKRAKRCDPSVDAALAADNLLEECADVLVVMDVLRCGMLPGRANLEIEDIYTKKRERWQERLEGKEAWAD